MKQMHKNRLLKLAAFLDKLPRHKFAFAEVISADVKSEHPLKLCGTTACALGWCPVVFPKFWHARFSNKNTGIKMRYYYFTKLKNCRVGMWRSAERFFGLSDREAEHLFNPYASNGLDSSSTAKQVARHILKFVKSTTKP